MAWGSWDDVRVTGSEVVCVCTWGWEEGSFWTRLSNSWPPLCWVQSFPCTAPGCCPWS